jgi:hypothetical protein
MATFVTTSRAPLLVEGGGPTENVAATFWSITGQKWTAILSAGFVSMIAFTYGTCLHQVKGEFL